MHSLGFWKGGLAGFQERFEMKGGFSFYGGGFFSCSAGQSGSGGIYCGVSCLAGEGGSCSSMLWCWPLSLQT